MWLSCDNPRVARPAQMQILKVISYVPVAQIPEWCRNGRTLVPARNPESMFLCPPLLQWNPALRTVTRLIRTPALYGQFCLSRQKAHLFSLKLTRFIRTPGNAVNGHFSVSRVPNSHIWSTPLYGHWLFAHSLFSLSQLCDNCRHCTLFK